MCQSSLNGKFKRFSQIPPGRTSEPGRSRQFPAGLFVSIGHRARRRPATFRIDVDESPEAAMAIASVSFSLRLPPDLYRQIVAIAASEGISLNEAISRLVASELGEDEKRPGQPRMIEATGREWDGAGRCTS